MSHNINLTIDGIPVCVPEGTRILEAARKVNVRIPTLCDHPDLCKRAVCRVCVVECDGRGKLVAACANDVWEGVKVVTNNSRLLSIRKTIIELLLANHPQECLTCPRSKNCALQSMAAEFGIREPSFRHSPAESIPPAAESETLVRDMGKCIKCGRCVEACQELQSIRAINSSGRGPHYHISAPYGQPLSDGTCVFCGRCLEVCPVGAIYEYDHSAQAWAVLRDNECRTAVQISPAMSRSLNTALGLLPGTISAGKIVTALKRLGFDLVYDADYFTKKRKADKIRELLDRIKQNGQQAKQKLPMISINAPGLINFIKGSYPDLIENLTAGKSSRQLFIELANAAAPKTACVSIVSSVAEKFRPYQPAADSSGTDVALTVRELAQMFKLAGIDFNGLPESPFDSADESPEPQAAALPAEVKILTIGILSEARIVMDSIRKGECDAALVEIMNCPLSL